MYAVIEHSSDGAELVAVYLTEAGAKGYAAAKQKDVDAYYREWIVQAYNEGDVI